MKKYQFNVKNIEVLGHLISAEGIQPLQSRVKAIRDFSMPLNLKQLQSFLGLINYSRKFIPNLSIIFKPLYDATRKELTSLEVKNLLKFFVVCLHI